MPTFRPPGARDRVTQLLAASTMGVYLLIAAGVTTALADAVAACPTWPLCDRGPFAALGDIDLAIALGHRAVALVVGFVLLVTVIEAWRHGVARRVRGALGIAAVLYPVEIGIGAATAVSDAPVGFSALHLVTAMGLFTALLVALLWELETDIPADESAFGSVPVEVPDSSLPSIDGQDSPGASVAAAARPTPDPGTLGRIRSIASSYLELTKPKLWWLLSLVALATMALAAGPSLSPRLAFPTLVGGVLAVAASGTFNNVIERDRDRWMARTADRPLARDRIPPRRAVAFGAALATGSVAVFLAFVNVLAAALGVLAILFYAVVYTLVLKPNTDQNTVLGGAAGVFPALIGWAAVEGAIGLPALVIGAIVFLWTPAHFYNLALLHRRDYARAGFPMLPVVRGEAITRRHIMLYLGATMIAAVVLGAATRLDWLYAATTVAVGGAFLWAVVRLHVDGNDQAAGRAFMASNAYLGLLLVAVVVDSFAI